MTRPGLLFYCQHSVGMGHLVRSLALADALSARFDVTLLSGGAVPAEVRVPGAIRLVSLPPLGHGDGYELVSRDPQRTVESAQRVRVARILDELGTVRPAAVIVELYPFGRRKFAFELVPLLEATHAISPRPLVLSSVRDILVSSRRDQARHDEQASLVANRWFDGVLVHADPRFARLDESFAPRTPLRVPVHYTGFVDRRPLRGGATARPVRRDQACVSAGGGLVGHPLLRAAIEAAPALHGELGLRTTAVTGPFLPPAQHVELAALAAATPSVRLLRFVPDLAAEMAASAVSVSQCGYNTTMDVLASGTPAVVVPYAEGREDEQLRRARRLEELRAVTLLDAARPLPGCARRCRPRRPGGLALPDLPPSRRRPLHDRVDRIPPRTMTGWLDTLRARLDRADRPVRFFFRDDDVGWGDERLWVLLDRLATTATPVDLAVIPAHLSTRLAAELARRARHGPIRFSQHGWAHVNHEPEGRRCEFGAARTDDAVRTDVRRGRETMLAAFGPAAGEVFVPPWNRCSAATARVLRDEGVLGLSRDATAVPFDIAGLVEVPVHVDWLAKRRGGGHVDAVERGELLATAASGGQPVGVMLHHAEMTDADFDHVDELARLLHVHPHATLCSIGELVREAQASASSPSARPVSTSSSTAAASPGRARPLTKRRAR